jgi:hypothetical protein
MKMAILEGDVELLQVILPPLPLSPKTSGLCADHVISTGRRNLLSNSECLL